MHAALAALVLAVAPSWGRLDLHARSTLYDSLHGSALGASAAQTLYAHELVDDALPMAFQTLEQELSSLSFSADYTHLSSDEIDLNGGSASVSGTLYVGGLAAFSATLAAEFDHEDTAFQTHDIVYPELWLAVGLANPRQRIWLGVHVAELYVDGRHDPRTEAMITVSGGTLVGDLFWFGAGLQTLPKGARLSLDAEVAPTHGSDLALSAFADRGQLYVNSFASYLRFGGSAFAGLWFGTVRVGLTYSLDSERQVGGSGIYGDASLRQTLELSVALRLH